MTAKKKTKRIFVSGGRGKYAPKYELKGDLFFRKGYHFSTRADWRHLLDDLYISERAGVGVSAPFRYYMGVARTDTSVLRQSANGVRVGCNSFGVTAVRKIAKWAGWQKHRIDHYLPRIPKVRA